ncbi:peroxiredoxin [Intrasporangium sp.]|uniref:peroxiredoxin n=1 Tax=Intrasporangium sp. TaxID=1925024 RepID=UPI003221A8E5
MSDARPVPAVGDPAPDFTLRDHHGGPVSLAGLRGRTNVALVFFPFAFSGICTGELREIRDGLEDFQHDGIQVLAISCDPMYSLRAWADAEGYFFPLLADFWPHGDVARRYGVLDEQVGAPGRATFLLDAEGLVVWRAVGPMGQRRDFGPYRAALAELRSRAS